MEDLKMCFTADAPEKTPEQKQIRGCNQSPSNASKRVTTGTPKAAVAVEQAPQLKR